MSSKRDNADTTPPKARGEILPLPGSWPSPSPPRQDKITAILLVSTVVLVLATGWVMWQVAATRFVQVLDNPVPQLVQNRLPGVPVPADVVTADIQVTGQKCNLSDLPVSVTGEVFWQSLNPRGTLFRTGGGLSPRLPGCEAFDFLNPVPAEVRARTTEMIERDRLDYVEWQIVGHERVQGNQTAEPSSWYTQPFRLYLEAPTP